MIFDHILNLEVHRDSLEERVKIATKLKVDHDRASDFLSELSRKLTSVKIAKLHPELVSLGFFLRRSETSRMTTQKSDRYISVPKGLLFHVPPANVDTIFVYSWAISLLCGNANVIRVSDRSGAAARTVLSIIRELFETKFSDLAKSQLFLEIPRDDVFFNFISSICDLRVLWGGDLAINELRKYSMDAKATDITFPDRSSFSCINSRALALLSGLELSNLIEKFANDVWWFDQAACSSPKMIFWVGTVDQNEKSRHVFLSALSHYLENANLGGDPAMSVERLSRLIQVAMTEESSLDFSYKRMATARTFTNPRDWLGTGSFIEIMVSSLDEIAPHVRKRDQTLTYFGFQKELFHTLITKIESHGIDRIVPIGEALSFDSVWDGYNLKEVFTRKITLL